MVALTEPAEFDQERAQRFFGRYVKYPYILGSAVWLLLALTTLHLADIPYAAALFGLWLLTWVINQRSLPRLWCGRLAAIHATGRAFTATVVRRRRLLCFLRPTVRVRLSGQGLPGEVEMDCFALPSQARSLRKGQQVEVLYAAALRIAPCEFLHTRACLPLWKEE
jgi:hypothetical protein